MAITKVRNRQVVSFPAFLVLAVLMIHHARALKFEDNGYKDLVVSISPDIEEGSNGQLIVDNIKVPFSCSNVKAKVTSKLLYLNYTLIILFRNGYV